MLRMFSRIFSRSHVTTYSVTVSYLLVNRRNEIRNGYTMFMLRNFEKEFHKRIASEFGVRRERKSTCCKGLQSFSGKARGFPYKNVLIRSKIKVWVATAGAARSIEWHNFMATKLKVNSSFCLGSHQRRLVTRRTALWVSITLRFSLHDLSCCSGLWNMERQPNIR